MSDTSLIWALVNFFFGASLVVVSICRINAMPPDTDVRCCIPYALLSCAGFVSALSPLQGHWPDGQHVFISMAFCVYVLTSKTRPSRSG